MTNSRPERLTLEEHQIVPANLKQINGALNRLLVDVIKKRKIRYFGPAVRRLATLRCMLDDIYCHNPDRTASRPAPTTAVESRRFPQNGCGLGRPANSKCSSSPLDVAMSRH